MGYIAIQLEVKRENELYHIKYYILIAQELLNSSFYGHFHGWRTCTSQLEPSIDSKNLLKIYFTAMLE